MNLFKTLGLCLFFVTLPLTAWSWGDDGHKIIGIIALQNLDDTDRAEVIRLTHLYKTPDGSKFTDFATALTYPDLGRKKAKSPNTQTANKWQFFSTFSRWHFLNVPRNTKYVEAGHCAKNCVLKGIDWHLKRVQNTDLTDSKRAEALFFLGHWIGDIHQPLHVSFADDLGGNTINPIKSGYYAPYSLHSVWDTGIIKKALGQTQVSSYALRLNSQISDDDKTHWIADSPLTWAQESYAIATNKNVDYCEWRPYRQGETCAKKGPSRTLGPDYQRKTLPYVEKRLQQAGIRLADYIRRGLHPE